MNAYERLGIVVEYAGQKGIPRWGKPPQFRWDCSSFANAGRIAPKPDETLQMAFAKDNAAEAGFNRWTINGIAYPPSQMMMTPQHHLKRGQRYRIKMRNASDDIHPIHLHRHPLN